VFFRRLKVTKVASRRSARIGRPGYKVTKERDPVSGQHCILFQLYFPDIEEGLQPRHRMMSAYEQRNEPADPKFQYVELDSMGLTWIS
jgi:splicing factor 3A subunit 2